MDPRPIPPLDPRPAFLALFLLLAGSAKVFAQPLPPPAQPGSGAGIVVIPTRLVFDGSKRTAELDLTNPGNAPGTFHINLGRMEMDENGHLSAVPMETTPGRMALQDAIRFGPKLVTLNPHETQVVRIQVRRPADLEPGEYRYYMVFRQEAPPPPEPAALPKGQEPKGISIHLTSLFGMAIPLIIRQGETSARVAITGMALEADGRTLRFRLERTGNQSVYGDLKAIFLPGAGKPQPVSGINGLAVYTPNPVRNITMPLDPGVPAGPRGGGRIQVTYTAPQDQGGALLAEASLEVR